MSEKQPSLTAASDFLCTLLDLCVSSFRLSARLNKLLVSFNELPITFNELAEIGRNWLKLAEIGRNCPKLAEIGRNWPKLAEISVFLQKAFLLQHVAGGVGGLFEQDRPVLQPRCRRSVGAPKFGV